MRMEKTEIVKVFLSKGYQLDSESLLFFEKNPDKIQNFLENVGELKLKDYIIKADNLGSLLNKNKIEVIKTVNVAHSPVSVADLSKNLDIRFQKLSEILDKKTELVNLISINKISDKTKHFSLIGLIKEKDQIEQNILVEDKTGQLTVHVENSENFAQMVVGEVAGLICQRNDGRVEVVETVWPDIPLKMEIAKSESNIFLIFLSDLYLIKDPEILEKILVELKKFKDDTLFTFILGDLDSDKELIDDFFKKLPKNSFNVFLHNENDFKSDKESLFLKGPSFVKLGQILIFISDGPFFSYYKNFWKSQPSEKIILNLLKKRHLNPSLDFNNKIYNEEDLVISDIPDIIAVGSFDGAGSLNYKGTTIVANGKSENSLTFWIVNLKTRETIKTTLS